MTSTPGFVAEQIERVLKPVQQFVRGWMLSDLTDAAAKELGLANGEQLWVIGRAGVMGDCDPPAAAAALAFIGPVLVAESWTAIPAGLGPRAIAERYAQLCAEWGTTELNRFDRNDLARMDELGRRVADAAPASLGAVFAGTRALPAPEDLGARVALTMHVLRELRGAAHIVAVLASGITPLDAILASTAAPPRRGPQWAQHLGWTGPFREPDDELAAARAEAERLTSRLIEPWYGSLSDSELVELVDLVERTRNAIDM